MPVAHPIPHEPTRQRKFTLSRRSPVLRHGSTNSNELYRDLTQGDYHKVADHTLEGILDVLETIGDEHDIDGYDVEYSVSERYGFLFSFLHLRELARTLTVL